VAGSEHDFVFAAVDVEERQSRGIEVHDFAGQVEFFAKSGTQAGGADALGTDYRVLFEHDGFQSRTRGVPRGGGSGGTAADNDEIYRLHKRGRSSSEFVVRQLGRVEKETFAISQ
jgi:hypothetical protein